MNHNSIHLTNHGGKLKIYPVIKIPGIAITRGGLVTNFTSPMTVAKVYAEHGYSVNVDTTNYLGDVPAGYHTANEILDMFFLRRDLAGGVV